MPAGSGRGGLKTDRLGCAMVTGRALLLQRGYDHAWRERLALGPDARHTLKRVVLATLARAFDRNGIFRVTSSKWDQGMAAEAMVELAQEVSAAVELLETAASTP